MTLLEGLQYLPVNPTGFHAVPDTAVSRQCQILRKEIQELLFNTSSFLTLGAPQLFIPSPTISLHIFINAIVIYTHTYKHKHVIHFHRISLL